LLILFWKSMRTATWSLLAGGAAAVPAIPAYGYAPEQYSHSWSTTSSATSCTSSSSSASDTTQSESLSNTSSKTETIPSPYTLSSWSSATVASSTTPAGPHNYPSKSASISSLSTQSTSTVTAPVYPDEYDSTVTLLTTVYTTYCPTTAVTYVEHGTTKIVSYLTPPAEATPTSAGSYGEGSPAGYVSSSPIVTSFISTYTTVWPITKTEVHEDSTITKTYETTSTVETLCTSTVDSSTTDAAKHDGPRGYGKPGEWTTVPWGSSYFSYIIPTPNPSTSQAQAYPIPTSHSGLHSYPAGNATKSYPYGTGSPSSTVSAKPTSTEACVPCKGQPGNDPDSYCGYTIHDNYYEVMPITCRTREYNFVITNTTIAPDGMPGPKIEANWGDTVVVHVTNAMQNNGTSIHFHGIRQNYTNEMDGVPSITQCALAPGESMTYTWKATNYGSSWYHSHFAIQTYEGVFGPMVIHGPAALDYDYEEMVVLQDWSHVTVDSMYQAAQTVGNGLTDPNHGPRTLDTGLINGLNVWGTDGAANATGERFRMNVEFGKKYRLRVVNTAIQSTFKFYVDGHTFKVIATDFVPIQPYETNILNINIGQRYDLIMTADQTPGNYWMRADNQDACAKITHGTNIKGIVSYLGAPADGSLATPTSTAYNYTGECVDEPYASLVPIVPLNAGQKTKEIDETVAIGGNGATPNLYKWTLSGTTFQSQWGDPTLSGILKNGTVPNYSGNLAITVPNLKEWVYVIVDSPVPLPHPIHLHGHDVFVLAQGKGLYNSGVPLNTVNPPRRDVVMMPWDPVAHTGGHIVLAFETDNPGAWLMHCHIGWHVAMGFALQIIEGISEIEGTIQNKKQMDDTCSSWASYAQEFNIQTHDSGV
ncbi:Laccase-1, partial [Pseudocercospora fuligena]